MRSLLPMAFAVLVSACSGPPSTTSGADPADPSIAVPAVRYAPVLAGDVDYRPVTPRPLDRAESGYSAQPGRPVMAGLPQGVMLAIPLAFLMGGCVTFTPDGGLAPVARQVSAEISGQVVKITSEDEAATARARVSALLSRPLDARAALQIE